MARPERPGRFARAAVFAGATLAASCGAPQPGPAGRATEAPPGDAAEGPLVIVDGAVAGSPTPVDAGAPALPPVDAAPPMVVIGPLDAGAPVAPAPAATGVIEGVLRSSGPGATAAAHVSMRLTGPGPAQTTATDEAGRFVFMGLAPGMWTVAYDDWWSRRPPPGSSSTVVERRIRIGRSMRPVSIRFTFKGAPPAMPVRVHQAMPYGAPPARRRVV